MKKSDPSTRFNAIHGTSEGAPFGHLDALGPLSRPTDVAAALPIGRAYQAIEQTIEARQLHSYLQVGRDFSNWVKERIEYCRLVEGRDFAVFGGAENLNDSTTPNLANGENKGVAHSRARIDYVLSLDAAKHIAMADRSRRGYEAREYFIRAETELRAMFGRPVVVPPKPIVQPPRPSAAREREERLRDKERTSRAKLLLEVAREQRTNGDGEGARATLDTIVRLMVPADRPALTLVPKGGA